MSKLSSVDSYRVCAPPGSSADHKRVCAVRTAAIAHMRSRPPIGKFRVTMKEGKFEPRRHKVAYRRQSALSQGLFGVDLATLKKSSTPAKNEQLIRTMRKKLDDVVAKLGSLPAWREMTTRQKDRLPELERTRDALERELAQLEGDRAFIDEGQRAYERRGEYRRRAAAATAGERRREQAPRANRGAGSAMVRARGGPTVEVVA